MYKFLIVEDDVLIAEHIREIVIKSGFEVIDVCESKNATLLSLEKEYPDAAFLDIRLAGVDDGIAIGKLLHEMNIPFAYITSFSDKKTVQDAVDTQPLAYLLKPFETYEIENTISKLTQNLSHRIAIRVNGVSQEILCDDILFIQSDNVYLEIHTDQGKYLIRDKLSSFQERLDLTKFVRIHRSYIVNKTRVTKRRRDKIWINGAELPISRKYQDQVEACFLS